MKPLAAQGEFLGARLKRIAEQGSYGGNSAPKGTNPAARPAIRGDLLIVIAADSQRDAKREMFIERCLNMQFGAALVIRRGVDCVDRNANRAGRMYSLP